MMKHDLLRTEKNVIFFKNLTCDTDRKYYIWFLKEDQSKVRALEKVKFIYSEKATKFCEISIIDLSM